MLLQIDEPEHELLLEVLGSALHTLREIEIADYESMRQGREAVMVSLRDRLVAQPSGALVGGSKVRGVCA